MIRIALLAASLIGAGYSAGRKMLAEKVEAQKTSIIDDASAMALERLDREVDALVARNLRDLLINVVVKLVLVGAAFAAFRTGLITAPVFAALAGSLLGLFLIRDVWRLAPAVRAGLRHLRMSGWQPRKAVTNYVSGLVFDQALQEIALQSADRKTKAMLRLAGTSHDKITVEIAEAVAEIASAVSFDKIKPRVIIAALRAAVILALYSAILFSIFRAL
ncbi:MAG: hypothetical protein AAFR20_09510 [Pseudomonadota bacterium]